MAREIDRKLRLTAAVLGTVTRKDLAAAFRRVNEKTVFDVGRADKWLQGRAQPRERQIYEDWSKVLDLQRSGQWIADCDTDAFLEEVCARHGSDREVLLRSLETASTRRSLQGPAFGLAGTFVCYSYSWSPYLRGRFIRGELVLAVASSPSRLPATYTEVMPAARMQLDGTMVVGKRAMHLDVDDGSGEVPILSFHLFPVSPPASVLGGLIFGTTIIGPDPQPTVSRVIMVRLPAAGVSPLPADAYLPAEASVAADLAALGLPVDDPAAVDQNLAEFFAGSGIGFGFDQVSASAYRALANLFDRYWLAGTP